MHKIAIHWDMSFPDFSTWACFKIVSSYWHFIAETRHKTQRQLILCPTNFNIPSLKWEHLIISNERFSWYWDLALRIFFYFCFLVLFYSGPCCMCKIHSIPCLTLFVASTSSAIIMEIAGGVQFTWLNIYIFISSSTSCFHTVSNCVNLVAQLFSNLLLALWSLLFASRPEIKWMRGTEWVARCTSKGSDDKNHIYIYRSDSMAVISTSSSLGAHADAAFQQFSSTC